MSALRPDRALWFAPVFLAVLACSLFNPRTTPPQQRPPDFSLVYEWREGTLPPPHYFQYTISVDPGGLVTVTFVPDYPGPDVPVWTETHQLDEAALDVLYAQMLADGALTTRWRAVDDPPVGGGSDWLTITANGQVIEVPPFPADSQYVAANHLQTAVVALVPAEIWDSLYAQREQYVADYQE